MANYLTKSDLVYEHLKAKVLSGALAPGARVTTESVSRELGVSGIPVREGIQRLEADGFLRRAPHKGAVVRTFDAGELDEIFAMLEELEPLALGRVEVQDLPAELSGTEREVLEEVYRAQDFGKVRELIEELLDLLDLYRSMYWAGPDSTVVSDPFVTDFVQLLKSGQRSAVLARLQQHRAQQHKSYRAALTGPALAGASHTKE